MANIVVETTKEEQDIVYAVLKQLNGAVTAVSAIAREANMREARTRYVIMDLIDQGRVKKEPHRAFNKHYVRYSYCVVE